MQDVYAIYEKLCKENNVTTADVSRATGIRHSTLATWKMRGGTPRIATLQKIADYFGVSIEYMMYGDGETPRDERYFLNDETVRIAQAVYEDKELRLLFDTAKDCSPEDIKTIHTMLDALKRKENNG